MTPVEKKKVVKKTTAKKDTPKKVTTKPLKKRAEAPTVAQENIVEAKLNEMVGTHSTATGPAPVKTARKFSWWAVFSIVLLVVFGAIMLYEHNDDFKLNTNKLLNAVGISKLPTEKGVPADKQEPFAFKLNVVFDQAHPSMKASIEDYFKNLEANLDNTKVAANWVDKNSPEGQAMIQKLGAKYLPVFTTDDSITRHPQYSLFSGVIKQNNGEYQLESEGMEYLEIPTVGEARYIGAKPENAKVVIQEYTSMTCGYCKAMNAILEKAVDTYGAQVSWVVKHFDRGGYDSELSQAVECAADQNRIRPMINALYTNQADIFSAVQAAGEDPMPVFYEQLEKTATEAGANGKKVVECVKAGTYAEKVKTDTAEAISFGVMGTPAFFINSTFVGGATEEATFMDILDAELKK